MSLFPVVILLIISVAGASAMLGKSTDKLSDKLSIGGTYNLSNI